MKKLTAAGIMLAFAFIADSFRSPENSKHFTLQQLSPGVWAAINNDHYGHAICNAGIIDLGDRTVLFDPFMNIDAAKDLKQVARQLTGKAPSLIINSHYHNDHIRGNQVFLPATIISTAWTRSKIIVSEPEELAWEKEHAARLAELNRKKLETASGREKEELPLWIGYYEAMVTNGPLVKITLPNLTFNDSLWIYGSKRNVLLIEYKNGHTESDVVMILPGEGIAFMGDLLFEKRHPYLPGGNPANWIKHLDGIDRNAGLHQFVPGHGAVCGKAGVRQMSGYITDLLELVDGAHQEAQVDSVLKQIPIPASYATWKFGQFFKPNLQFLLLQRDSQKN